MQVISWLTCDFYLVVASGIQLSLRFCCSVQQVSHVLSLSFPNSNTEQPIHNLLRRQWRPRTLVLGCAAKGRRTGVLLGGVTHKRDPSATKATWVDRSGEKSNMFLQMVPLHPTCHPTGFWSLSNPKVMELPQALSWKSHASNFLLYDVWVFIEKITCIRSKWPFYKHQQRIQWQIGRVNVLYLSCCWPDIV